MAIGNYLLGHARSLIGALEFEGLCSKCTPEVHILGVTLHGILDLMDSSVQALNFLVNFCMGNLSKQNKIMQQ